MDDFQIETAQNISIGQNVASEVSRIGAFVIDAIILGAYVVFVVFIVFVFGDSLTDSFSFSLMLFLLPVFFYHLLFELFMNGQSPGKYYQKIRVVKLDGSAPTLGDFILRWILRPIDIGLASGAVALLTIVLNGKGQRLGDMAAGTTVVSEKVKVSINDTLIADIPDDYVPTFLQVTLLSDVDIQTIKGLYLSAKKKGDHNLIIKLYDKIISITEINTDIKPVELIDIVIKDYNYYTQR